MLFRKSRTAVNFLRNAEKFQVGQLAAVESWLQTISSKATSPEGKLFTAQLSSIITFYNKAPLQHEVQEINWEDWTNRLSTKSLVGRIRENTETLLKEKYNVAAVADKITSQPSAEYVRISDELYYHYALWVIYSTQQAEVLVDVEETGNLLEYNQCDAIDRFFGMQSEMQKNYETGMRTPGSTDDVNYTGFIMSQLDWGKQVATFYRHPFDDYRCLVATKNILGR